MTLAVKILDKVFKRIQDASEPCLGFLFGVTDTQKKTVWIISLEKPLGKSLVNSYPVGVNVCGTFQIVQENERLNVGQGLESGDSNISVIITAALGQKKSFKVYLSNNGKLEVEYEVVDETEFYKEHILLHCKGEIPIKCEYEKEVIKDLILNLKNNLSTPNSLCFKLSKIFLMKEKVIGTDGNININEIYSELNQNEEIVTKKRKNQSTSPKVIELNTLWRKSLDDKKENAEKPRHAPVCILNKNASTVIDTIANVDALIIIPGSLQISNLYEILVQAVNRYLSLFEDNLREYIGFKHNDTKNLKFQTFHFYPAECGCFITLLYLENKPEALLKSYRQLLHKQLLLDELTPKFRRANQYSFNNMNKSSSILVNPHQDLRTTDNGGDLALVRGKYEYYHYCQNGEDDNGWGCAYRSLQTLASWFKLQGYVEKPVPTIADIQKCLVDIKDKPANFVGSRQWIGSTEVSFVLNTLFGIDSKILHVSSGEEMGTKGPELVNHFLTQGSPIMIGGGVLAHTILGVDYNRSTGSLKFLILDPHYTGTEDLHTVQSKGWCGWKGVEFWKKGSYYNMCLPQVLKDI